jgi:hypothetical protein
MPALVLALTTTPGIVVDMPVVLNGVRLGLDVTGRGFLLFSALLWLIAGLYARVYVAGDGHERRFWIFFLITEAGNLGLVLALDITSFYLAFALMTFAAYGLVVHSGEEGALRAGRVYLVMAVLGAGRHAGIWLVSVVAAASVAWLALGAGILEIDLGNAVPARPRSIRAGSGEELMPARATRKRDGKPFPLQFRCVISTTVACVDSRARSSSGVAASFA